MPRPCPFVTCRHHRALDVLANGSLNLDNLGGDQSDAKLADAICKMKDSCTLDIADKDEERPLSEVAGLMGISAEFARVLEMDNAAPKMREGLNALGYDFVVQRGLSSTTVTNERGLARVSSVRAKQTPAVPYPPAIRERAIRIYHKRGRASARDFVELATGRNTRGSLIRTWARTQAQKLANAEERRTNPWHGIRYSTRIVNATLDIALSGMSQRKVSAEASRSMGATISPGTVLRWLKIYRAHGRPSK